MPLMVMSSESYMAATNGCCAGSRWGSPWWEVGVDRVGVVNMENV